MVKLGRLIIFYKEGFEMEFLTEKLLFIALFIFIIHSIETLAYAVRLSGARVKMIASALSQYLLKYCLFGEQNTSHGLQHSLCEGRWRVASSRYCLVT